MTDPGPPVVGVIGLGNMGAPIAARVADAGHQVVGYDAAGVDGRLPSGAVAAASAAEVAGASEIVLLSLPDGPVSRSVCGEIAAAGPGARFVVDTSTIGPVHAQACADELAAAGMSYVDAPVSGGVPGAWAGTLAVMVAGPPEAVTAVEPVLGTFGGSVTTVGATPGLGQSMKLINNFLSNAAFVATSEAVAFGLGEGLDLETMLDVLNASTGRNSATAFKFPRAVVPATFDLGFLGSGAQKDIDLYATSVADRGTPDVLGRALADSWAEFVAESPGQDTTYYYRWLQDRPEPTRRSAS